MNPHTAQGLICGGGLFLVTTCISLAQWGVACLSPLGGWISPRQYVLGLVFLLPLRCCLAPFIGGCSRENPPSLLLDLEGLLFFAGVDINVVVVVVVVVVGRGGGGGGGRSYKKVF